MLERLSLAKLGIARENSTFETTPALLNIAAVLFFGVRCYMGGPGAGPPLPLLGRPAASFGFLVSAVHSSLG